MDEKFTKLWFDGFANGIDCMEEGSRNTFLGCCAKACADSGVIEMYKKYYADVKGDRDSFYANMSTLGGVSGKVLIPGKQYEICFPECYCDLHTSAGVNTPNLCECSRQSILYVGRVIWGDVPCTVEKVHTILDGAKECRFRVTFE